MGMHNCHGPALVADRPFHFLVRDNATSTTWFLGCISDPTQADSELEPRVASAVQLPVDFDDFVTLANTDTRPPGSPALPAVPPM
jgi:hypothetical protein